MDKCSIILEKTRPTSKCPEIFTFFEVLFQEGKLEYEVGQLIKTSDRAKRSVTRIGKPYPKIENGEKSFVFRVYVSATL
jgi:hypothetical protein